MYGFPHSFMNIPFVQPTHTHSLFLIYTPFLHTCDSTPPLCAHTYSHKHVLSRACRKLISIEKGLRSHKHAYKTARTQWSKSAVFTRAVACLTVQQSDTHMRHT